MRKLTAFAAAVAILATASVGHAGSLARPCTAASQDKWLTIEALQSKVEALGYRVRNGKGLSENESFTSSWVIGDVPL
jgi:hypothetical protein